MSEDDRAIPLGPAALVQVAKVARRYHFDGANKSEIAAELGLSRFKVARLLDQARDSGLVRIEIDYRGQIDLERSAALGTAYGLRHAVVIDCADADDAVLRTQVGSAGAWLLAEIVTADDVLGLVWSRSLMAMRSALRRLSRCAVVQLTGAISLPDFDESVVDLVRDVARISGGSAHYFYAPMIVGDAATARALRAQPEIARALACVPDVTKAMVAVGAWRPGESAVVDAIGEAERVRLHDLGVRAEVAGIAIDESGQSVPTPLADRIIGIDAEQLRAVPEVIGLAYGASKADAVAAALAAGLVTSLVTHTSLASALLDRV